MRVAVIGGDKRMLYCAKAFCDRGYDVVLSGFDTLKSNGDIRSSDAYTAAAYCDMAVLPMNPVSQGCVTAPFSKDQIRFSTLSKILGEKPLCCGMSEKLSPYDGKIIDYSKHEGFLIQNAVLTAEGALSSAMNEYEGSVWGSKTLVTGYGRIGRALCRKLMSLHSDVTVAARKESDRAWITAEGMRAADFSFSKKERYDLIFNTVPFPVLDRRALDSFEGYPLLFDLASLPGGADHDYAGQKGIQTFHLLSVPGRYAPASAGSVIAETIIKILEEQ